VYEFVKKIGQILMSKRSVWVSNPVGQALNTDKDPAK
jgi:hypothetical protein